MLNAGIEVKVEDYDGTYVCLFCGESVRGQPALKCSHCSSNPFHLACVALAHSKYAEVCPTCDRKTVEAWGRASGGTAGASEIIDLREERDHVFIGNQREQLQKEPAHANLPLPSPLMFWGRCLSVDFEGIWGRC